MSLTSHQNCRVSFDMHLSPILKLCTVCQLVSLQLSSPAKNKYVLRRADLLLLQRNRIPFLAHGPDYWMCLTGYWLEFKAQKSDRREKFVYSHSMQKLGYFYHTPKKNAI